MQQDSIFEDSIEDAIDAVIRGTGGYKKVAGDWFGDSKNPVEGGRYLQHCLDPERSEKMGLDLIQWLFNRGRQSGIHTMICHIADTCDYTRPSPIARADKKAELQLAFTESVKQQAGIVKRMEALG